MKMTIFVLIGGFILSHYSFAATAPGSGAPGELKVLEVSQSRANGAPVSIAGTENPQNSGRDGSRGLRSGSTGAASEASILPLPKKGEEVPMAKIKEICRHFGLHDLWRKIEKDPPPLPFRSDGCSMWFDEWRGIDLYPACFLHDLKYWAGYPNEDVERLIADAELMIAVARLTGSTVMAETMFHGVRPGGHEMFKQPFSWGFGRATK